MRRRTITFKYVAVLKMYSRKQDNEENVPVILSLPLKKHRDIFNDFI